MAIIDNLQKVIECREDEGKLYIMVYPETNKDVVLEMFNVQYRNVLNGDMDLVRKVVSKASGEWECVGDMPEPYNINFDRFIEVRATPENATLRIMSVVEDQNPTFAALMHRIKNSGITFGIKENVMKDMIERKIYDTDVVVAEGIAPVEGIDGMITYNVNLEKSYEPKKNDDGTVDYREIAAFPTVMKGDIIATTTPAEQGTPGMSIFGKEIPVKLRRDYNLKPSASILVSEDGRQLIADATGIIINKNGILSIKDSLELQDVDFETGNIRFPGNVIINGNVNAGFLVESDSDVLINGMVESATIKSGGIIKIKGGIVGKNSTLISAKKRVEISFGQDAKIECLEGAVEVRSYLRHCKVVCKEFMTLDGEASVIGGKIEAVDSIKIAECSNEDEVLTELVLFDPLVKELTGKRMQLVEAKTQIDKVYVPLERDYKNKAAYVKTLGHKPGSQEYYVFDMAKQKFEGVKQKYELVESQIKKIDEMLTQATAKKGSISIFGKGHGGTRIQIGKAVYSPKGEVFRRKFYLDGADIASVPLS